MLPEMWNWSPSGVGGVCGGVQHSQSLNPFSSFSAWGQQVPVNNSCSLWGFPSLSRHFRSGYLPTSVVIAVQEMTQVKKGLSEGHLHVGTARPCQTAEGCSFKHLTSPTGKHLRDSDLHLLYSPTVGSH